MNPIILYFLVALISSDVYAANCESGWREFRNNCYLFSPTKSNWLDARKSCEGKKAHLATVTSQDEHNFLVQQIILEGTSHSWIGGNDIGREGIWAWEHTGEHFKFTKWHPGQPDNGKNEQHCLLMNAGLGYNWDDIKCDDKYPFVCERPSIKEETVCQQATVKCCKCPVSC